MLASIALIAVVTLVPLGTDPPRFDWGTSLADALVNVALFLPLGFGLGRSPWSRVALTALALSGCVELLQGTAIPGRHGAVTDVAANVTGAVTGAVLLRAPAVLLALPVAAWLASGLALSPAPPRTPLWWGQWAHPFRGTEPFPGTIIDVRLLGRAAQDGGLDSTGALVADAQRNGLALEVTLLSGGTTRGLTHLAGIADGRGHGVIVLEQTGDALLLSWRSRGAAAGLRAPLVVFPAALPPAPNERIAIDAAVRDGKAAITVESPGRSFRRALRFTPVSGWRNFLAIPSSRPWWQRVATVVWTASGIGYAAMVAFVVIRRRRTAAS